VTGVDISAEQMSDREPLIPRMIVVIAAFLCAGVLITVALMGPLGTGSIQYRTSQSGKWQIQGGDVVNLFLIAPILLIGGVLHMLKRNSSRYFLILTPVVLIYTGLTLGIGQEWGNPAYTGNSEQYAWLFLIMVIGGLLLLIGSLTMFTESDAPEFKPRGLRIYVGVMSLFLLVFAAMWLSELMQVISTGDLSSGAYSEAPVLWWTVRFLDLGLTIPLGFLALSLLLSRPKRSYSIVLLFFGFFVTLGTAVLSMAIVMAINEDPEAQPGSLVVFASLAALSWGGLLYLVKDKLPRFVGR